MGRADIRVAIDIGGTFVAAISFDPADSSVRTWKSPTTPDRAARSRAGAAVEESGNGS